MLNIMKSMEEAILRTLSGSFFIILEPRRTPIKVRMANASMIPAKTSRGGFNCAESTSDAICVLSPSSIKKMIEKDAR